MQPPQPLAPVSLRPMNVTEMIDASFRLYRANFVTFLGIVALLQVPMMIVLATMQYALGTHMGLFFQQLAGGRNQLDVIGRNQAILTLVSQISTMLVAPLQLTLFTLLYYDLRVRKEGYDLELRALHPVTS